MARKTFGRGGQSIVITEYEPANDGEQPIVESIAVDEHARVDDDADDAGGIEDAAGIDFEPVGETIRTEPIAGAPGEFFDPASAGGRRLNKDGTPRRKRGEGKARQANVENTRVISVQLEKVLFSLHTMAAATLREPELAIDEDEARILAGAVEKVANAYNFSAMFSPKAQAGVDLCIALVTVYGHRVMTMAKRPKHTVRNVTPIDKVGQQS
jgi:hypothetical protein